MKTARLRSSLPAAGTFVSLPEAFEGADDAVIFAPKVQLRAARFEDSKHPLKIETVIHPHTLLIDLEAVDAQAFNPEKIIKDCEILKDAVSKNPEELKRILSAFAADAPHDRILDAAKLVEKLGLSEDQIVKRGGGFLWIVIIVAAIALSSCKGCAHTKGSMRQE